jgi:hypothetical protein
MTKSFQLAIALVFAILLGSMQAATMSPKDIVGQFVKMDAEGERLTPEGWHQADAFFVKPSEPPRSKVLVVIARGYAVSTAAEKTNSPEFYMGYEEVGRIDATSLRFAPSNTGTETRSFVKYSVVSADVNGVTDAAQTTSHAGNTSPAWRIDGTQPPAMHLTAAAAIRYITQMRSKATDPLIQKNADLTIKKLVPYR